jgi:hypothetical protein
VRLSNNFTDDIIRIFQNESQVGAILHVTNNPKFCKAEHTLNYEILNPPLYQGWDFCFKREAYTKIPDSLRIFGGDDFLFGHLKKGGFKIAFTYSSPIIHYKERTRIKMGSIIHQIQQEDIKNYHIQMKRDGYQHTNSTMNTDKSNKYPPDGMKLTQNTNCVFTTIINNYSTLNEVEKKEGWDYVCFTNDKNLKSNTWKIVYYPKKNETNLENYKLSRYYKTNFHKYLLSYENLIYIDARMKISGDLNVLLQRLKDVDISFMKHPEAKSIKQEMDRVLRGKLEGVEMVNEIKKRYEKEGYLYDNGLFAGGILIFKNNERTIKFFKEWWYEIKNYSYRDQLSLNFVVSRNPELKYSIQPFSETVQKYFKMMPRKSKRLTF